MEQEGKRDDAEIIMSQNMCRHDISITGRGEPYAQRLGCVTCATPNVRTS